MLRAGRRSRAGEGAAVKLYMFEHCYLCFRVRMTAVLARKHLVEAVVLEDDTDTMVALAGRRVVPILVRDDGQPMLESMDIVRYIDRLGAPVLTGPERPEIRLWAEQIAPKAAPLTQPRYPLLGLPEFGSAAARAHYRARKRRALGDLDELLANTKRHLGELMPDLQQIDRMLESPRAVNGALSLDDVRVLPMLRSLAVVKELRFPERLRSYFESMMALIGARPLPTV
jgi:glutaredoxin 2